jgi:hypothetical protein
MISLIPCLALNRALMLQLLFLPFLSSSLRAAARVLGGLPPRPSNLALAASILDMTTFFVWFFSSSLALSSLASVFVTVMVVSVYSGTVAPCSGSDSTLLLLDSMRRRGLVGEKVAEVRFSEER